MTRVIHWFRQDLRLSDNPALCAAACAGAVIPVYILDDVCAGDDAMGAASRIRLHKSLEKLNESLEGRVQFFCGDARKILPKLVQEWHISAVFWNRAYEPWRMQRDQEIKSGLKQQGIRTESFQGSALWEPWTIHKSDGTPYKVFTPFYRKGCLSAPPPRAPLPKPEISFAEVSAGQGIATLDLVPEKQWAKDFLMDEPCGEIAAQNRLQNFVQNGLAGYKQGRNMPALPHVSRLSSALHFGEISPNQAWHAADFCDSANDVDHFRSELGWREFSIAILYHYPELRRQNFNPAFEAFPWRWKHPKLAAWQMGQSGYPIIDAGMRELYQTGGMHNRVRMIVASFLVKNMLVHWRVGEAWFWDTLIDADQASNSASWQWVAGSGADGAPYFRIFNPILQGEKFDPEGEYTLRYVPELKDLPKKFLHQPWQASKDILRESEIVLGRDYPEPIVDLSQSRRSALEAFEMMKMLNQDST